MLIKTFIKAILGEATLVLTSTHVSSQTTGKSSEIIWIYNFAKLSQKFRLDLYI